jgi:RpiR family carbohydrate utilization transcriptional regulator
MTMNMTGACFSRIRAGIQQGSEVVVKIGRFVLKSPLRSRNMSTGDLAKASGASASTVYRFCRDLGYAGYKEFQLDLATSVATAEGLALGDFDTDASLKTILHRVFEYHRASLFDTERIIYVPVLTTVAKLILKCQMLLLLGICGSGLAALRATDNFLSLGYTAVAVTDPYAQIFATQNTGPHDVVIGISHTGQTTAIIEAVQTARRHGARTVALSNYPPSSLAISSEFQLITAFHEHPINAAVPSSITAQLVILSSLYFILGSWGGRKAKRLADEAEERSRGILRTPGPHRRVRTI